MAATSPLYELVALANEPSSSKRRELLRRVTDLFVAANTDHTAIEMRAFDGVLTTLASEVEQDVRMELAKRLGSADSAPAMLAMALARDCIEVALPILSNERLLSEADLIAIVSSQGQPHLRVVSARPDLTEAVSDLIVDRGDDETVEVLLGNETASISRSANELVVERAVKSPELQAAIIGRQAMPLDLVNGMYLLVEKRLRDRIRTRNAEADPATLDAALRKARSRASASSSSKELDAAMSDVANAASRNKLTHPELLSYLREDRLPHFAAGLAHLADVEPSTVHIICTRGDLDGLAVLCKAVNIERALFLSFAIQFSGERDAVRKADTYAQLYNDLPQELAARTLRFWRVRCEGEGLTA